MYTSFYNLNKKPFQISSDPAFMWFGEKHKEALATLKYGILDNKGFLLLTGDVGTGKTTLINSLIQSLSDDIICAAVPDPGLEKLDFFNYIAASFGSNYEFSSKGVFLTYFRKFLMDASENNKKVLLIIDEAQLLTQEMLEEIRLLSNIEKMDAKLINIFFIGQNEFNEILNREQNRAVRQRLTLNYNIDPLTPDETGEYINHRLKVSGAAGPIFDESATQEVFMYSGGFPRRINIICDHSLLSGYVKEQKTITAAIVKECARDLKIPAHVRNRDINGFEDYHDRFVPAAISQPPLQQAEPGRIDPGRIENRNTFGSTGIENRKKSKLKSFITGIVCLFFVFSVWFFLFPDSFKNSIALISQNMTGLQYKLSQVISGPATSSLKQKQVKEDMADNMEKEKIVTKKVVSPNEENQVMGEIKIFEDEKFNEDEFSHIIQPQEGTESEVITVEKELEIQQDPEKVPEDIKVLPLPDEKTIVRFTSNTNDFTEEGFKQLIGLTDVLITHPEVKILISGHTDSAGNQNYNLKLSEFRANIVRSFFLGRGINIEQIQIKGLGSQNPIETNDTSWGRQMNRRVEIEVIK